MSIVAASAASAQQQRRATLADLVYTQGECANESSDMWYPLRPDSLEITAAKRVCLACPVREACLELALRIDAGQHGIWGSMGEDERRALLRQEAQRLKKARRLDELADRRPRRKTVAA